MLELVKKPTALERVEKATSFLCIWSWVLFAVMYFLLFVLHVISDGLGSPEGNRYWLNFIICCLAYKARLFCSYHAGK